MNSQHHLKKSLFLLQSSSRTSSSSLSSLSSLSSSIKPFSTSSTPPKKKKKPSSQTPPPNPHSQPFVTHRLRPGQPNPLHQIYSTSRKSPKIRHKSDPLHRPPWKRNTKANIISPEDFAARPRVAFEEQFDSLHDGMIVLGWIDKAKQQEIYASYTSLMLEQESAHQKTSHEYVMRVLGQQYNISSMRAAAIVDAMHEEEQARKNAPEYVYDKLAEYVDAKIMEHINNVYTAYGEPNPNEFLEDPVEGSGVIMNTSDGSGEMVAVDDLYDIDDMTKRAIMREKDEAQLEIDGHVYREDIDENQVESEVNKECLNLIKAQEEAKKVTDELWEREESGSENESEQVERRPRWKFVAQTINVREQKKAKEKFGKKKKKKSAKQQQKTNTIVEQDGSLRVATMKEVNNVAWKDVRDVKEFGFKGVKSAWLNRKSGERAGWGHVPEEIKAAAKAKLEEKEAQKTKEEQEQQEGETEAGDGDDNSTETNSNDEEK